MGLISWLIGARNDQAPNDVRGRYQDRIDEFAREDARNKRGTDMLMSMLREYPVQNYWTNDYVSSFTIDKYDVDICDQDTRWVGTMHLFPTTKLEHDVFDDYIRLCIEDADQYQEIKRLLNNSKKVDGAIPGKYDDMVINGVKYDWRTNSVFGRYRGINPEEKVLFEKVKQVFAANSHVAIDPCNGGFHIGLRTPNNLIYIWEIDAGRKYELRILSNDANSVYDDTRTLYQLQTDGTGSSDCVLSDGTPVYVYNPKYLGILNEVLTT